MLPHKKYFFHNSKMIQRFSRFRKLRKQVQSSLRHHKRPAIKSAFFSRYLQNKQHSFQSKYYTRQDQLRLILYSQTSKFGSQISGNLAIKSSIECVSCVYLKVTVHVVVTYAELGTTWREKKVYKRFLLSLALLFMPRYTI